MSCSPSAGNPPRDIRATDSACLPPPRLPVRDGNGRLPDRGRRRRRRSRAEHLGHVLAHPGADTPRRHRGRRLRPLPPVGRRPRPHGRARPPCLPTLVVVGAPATGRGGRTQPRGRPLLPRAPRWLPSAWDHTAADPLPLGPAATTTGRRWLAEPRDRPSLRRLRQPVHRCLRRSRRRLDHDQRAVVRVVPLPRVGRAGTRRPRPRTSDPRRPSHAARPRARTPALPGQDARRQGGDHQPVEQREPAQRLAPRISPPPSCSTSG